MNTTVRIKASQIYKDWHVIDAAGRPLGRVATEAATLLRGKHKPTYEPHLDDGDFVIVINASQVRVTGRKSSQIKYYTHSGYPGGLKTRSYDEQLARYPERVLEQAIWGMLPGGPLGKAMFRHLKVYKGANHPHQSQILGSQRAAENRPAVTAPAPAKPARLRPLSVPQDQGAAPAKAEAPVRIGKAPKSAPAATVATEMAAQDEAVLTSESTPPVEPVTAEGTTTVDYGTPTPAEAAIAAEAPAEEKKPRAPRKKAEAAADAPVAEATEEKKPRRRAAKTEE